MTTASKSAVSSGPLINTRNTQCVEGSTVLLLTAYCSSCSIVPFAHAQQQQKIPKLAFWLGGRSPSGPTVRAREFAKLWLALDTSKANRSRSNIAMLRISSNDSLLLAGELDPPQCRRHSSRQQRLKSAPLRMRLRRSRLCSTMCLIRLALD